MLANSAGITQQSMTTFNKISREMQKLSQLISQEQQYKQQLRHALQSASLQDSSESALSNLDLYFQEYNNPTTKSLPYEPDPDQLASQILEGDSETINTIYRNPHADISGEADRDNNPDDKSTVILAALKLAQGKEKEEEQRQSNPSVPHHGSLQYEGRVNMRDSSQLKWAKSNSKNATSSMPSECHPREHYKSQNHITKNSSLTKTSHKVESPVMGLSKNKKTQQIDQQCTRDNKGKLTKISKIDRQELNKLQEKKAHKKTDLSSNRKKTKRSLGAAKSSSNIVVSAKMTVSSANYASQKSSTSYAYQKPYGNVSCKKFDSYRKELNRREDKLIPNHQDWQRMEKTSKKLNRVNIGRLQENMKKANEKKPGREIPVSKIEKKHKKGAKFQSYHRQNELKLHFTEGDEESPMKKLIEEKQLSREYTKETDKYLTAAKQMSKALFQTLIKECRQASEEAILKIKLVSLIIYFFDQFSSTSLLAHQKMSPSHDEFFTCISQEQIIQVLLHPKKVMKIIEKLPSIFMNDNIVSAERSQLFIAKFAEVNEQLDQQLEFFLIKKGTLYAFIHALSEYLNFLIQMDLIAQTKRSRLIPVSSKQPLHGFYSGRSKREENSQKYIKKSEGGNRLGFRCDSDRKITLQDEQICFKEVSRAGRKQSSAKPSMQLKKLFK